MEIENVSSAEELYRFLRETDTKLLSNIIFGHSPGHQIQELDYFLRKYHAGVVPREGNYVWIQGGGDVTGTIADVYGDAFRQYNLTMIARDDLFAWASEILQMVPELGVDVGLSHHKIAFHSSDESFVERLFGRLYHAVSNDFVMRCYKDYFKLRGKTAEFDPWTTARPLINENLAEFLGGQLDRIALVHVRSIFHNAGVPIPAENLLPTIRYLKESGFTVVKCGTEPYPSEFRNYDVINYSESPLRCYRNDLALLSHSKFCLIAASGLENLPEIMDIPIVSYARWNLNLVSYSRNAVTLPVLLFDPDRQKWLSFAEQLLFFRTRREGWETSFHEVHPPINKFHFRLPQPDEILSAVQEALELGDAHRPPSLLHERFRRFDENGLWQHKKGRISESFLEKHQHLL